MNKTLDNLTEIVSLLHQGGVILCPTDTIWGLSCKALDEHAVDKIYKLKSRDRHKPFILLMSDLTQLKEYVTDIHPRIEDLLIHYKKPVTFIHKAGVNLPSHLTNAEGTVAVRLTHDSVLQDLIRDLGSPIVSTSANVQGAPSPVNFNEIDQQIKEKVDYVFQTRQNDVTKRLASPIIRYSDEGELIFLRE